MVPQESKTASRSSKIQRASRLALSRRGAMAVCAFTVASFTLPFASALAHRFALILPALTIRSSRTEVAGVFSAANGAILDDPMLLVQPAPWRADLWSCVRARAVCATSGSQTIQGGQVLLLRGLIKRSGAARHAARRAARHPRHLLHGRAARYSRTLRHHPRRPRRPSPPMPSPPAPPRVRRHRPRPRLSAASRVGGRTPLLSARVDETTTVSRHVPCGSQVGGSGGCALLQSGSCGRAVRAAQMCVCRAAAPCRPLRLRLHLRFRNPRVWPAARHRQCLVRKKVRALRRIHRAPARSVAVRACRSNGM